MAVQRDDPYPAFNFLVDLGTGHTEGPDAGFQECSGIGMEVSYAEYRNGNDKVNNVRKIPGLAKVPDVTLKRGLIGSLTLYRWIDEVRDGDQNARRTVLIHLQNEDRTEVVMTWILHRAWPTKITGPALNARNSEVAIEELTLAYERLALE